MSYFIKPILSFLILIFFFIFSPPGPARASGMEKFLQSADEILFSQSDASPDAKALFDKAADLSSPARIYEYVRNHYEYDLYHGSRGGSINTFLGGRGNDVDLASTLIAMLRSQNIPARYVTGNVRMKADDAANWLGAGNADLAAHIMRSVGIQGPREEISGQDSQTEIDTGAKLTGDKRHVEFEHVWVEALVPYGDYRGAGPDASVDCGGSPERCQWIGLDPSFKLRRFRDQNIHIYDVVPFDYNRYYHAIKNNDGPYMDKNPLEIYKEEILKYLRDNHPGKTLNDVMDPGKIIPEEAGFLPASLPFKILGATRRYASVQEHDQASLSPKPKDWAKYLSVNIKINDQWGGASTNVLLSDMATRKLALSYEAPADGAASGNGRLTLRLGGQEIAELFSGQVTAGDASVPLLHQPFFLKIRVDGWPSTEEGKEDIFLEDESLCVAGNHYVITAGGETSNWSQVHRATRLLLDANDAHPIVNRPQTDWRISEDEINAFEMISRLADSKNPLSVYILGRFSKAGRDFVNNFDIFKDYPVSQANEDLLIAQLNAVIRGPGIYDPARFSGVELSEETQALADESPSGNELEKLNRRLLEDAYPRGIAMGMEEIPYVDGNQNGAVDSGESPLGESPDAQRALTEGLLYAGAALYGARVRDAGMELGALNHVLSPGSVLLGVTKSASRAEYLDGTSFSIMPAGLVIDMAHVVAGHFHRNPGTGGVMGLMHSENRHHKLSGHIDSSFEHEIWQELTGYDAISTVRGIQKALAQDGAQLLHMKDPATDASEDTPLSAYPKLGFLSQAPAGFTRHDRSLFKRNPTSWSFQPDDGEEYGFYTFKKIPAASDSDLRLKTMRYSDILELVNLATQLHKNKIDSFTGSYIWWTMPFFGIDGWGVQTKSGWMTLLQNGYGSYINLFNSSGQMYDYFDRNHGFDPADQVYLAEDASSDIHGVGFISSIRHAVYLPPDGVKREFVMSSRKTMGSGHAFSVAIDTAVDASDGYPLASSYMIYSEELGLVAGGGYVDGWEPLSEHSDDTGLRYDNSYFTDEDVILQTNNHPWLTPSTADPVSTVTGNMYHDETDFVIEGRGLDMVFTRTYNSTDASSDGPPLSPGWTHSWNMRLTANSYGKYPDYPAFKAPENGNGKTSSITYTNERGGESNYLVDSSGDTPTWEVTSPEGIFDTLATDSPSNGLHTLGFRNGVKYIFYSGPDAHMMRTPGATARLERIEDPYGNTLSFTYAGDKLTGVADNLGITSRTGMVLSYNADNRLRTVQDWTGRTWTCAYDTNKRLQSVTDPLGNVTIYAYDGDTDYLESVSLPETRGGGKKVKTTFEYYRNGKAFRYFNPFGETETLDYDLFRRRTRVTDPRGHVRTHHYDEKGSLTKLAEPDGGVLLFENNGDGLREEKIGPLGYVTQYSYMKDRSFPAESDAKSDNHGRVSKELDPLGHFIEYDYGIHDQPTRIRDKNGRDRVWAYYAATSAATGAVKGKLERESIVEYPGTDEAKTTVLKEYTYTPGGNLKTMTEYIDPADPSKKRVTEYFFDQNPGFRYNGLDFRPWKKTVKALTEYSAADASEDASGDALVVETRYDWDDLGRMTEIVLKRRTSPSDSTLLDLTTAYAYDDLGRLISETDPAGNIKKTFYDPNGKKLKDEIHYKRPAGTYDIRVVKRYEYDAADRLFRERDIDGNETLYEHDEMGNVIQITDPGGHSVEYGYDPMGRRVSATDANGHETENQYDPAGNLIAVTDPGGDKTTFEYDKAGRKKSISTPMGRQTVMTYDANGNVTNVKDPADASTDTAYDAFNRKTRITDFMNGETSHTYDLLGNITSLTDAEGRTTTFVYNDLGRLKEIIDPVVESPDRTTRYAYDQAGNLHTMTDRNGESIRYTYDRLNRLIETEFVADGTRETREYDIYGNLIRLTGPGVSYAYTYDTHNRLKSKTDSRRGKNLEWFYDSAGNLERKIDFQGEETRYLYDSSNRLVGLENNGYLQASYYYSPAGRLVNRILSNGAGTHYTYDDDGRLTGIRNTSADGTPVHRMDFSHDRAGNITKIDASTDSVSDVATYTYDGVYRLTGVDASGDANDQTWTYDKVGNRKTLTKNGQTLHYIYDAGNRLTEVRSGSETGPLVYTYEYDSNGSRTAKKGPSGNNIQSYEYDQKRRMTRLTDYRNGTKVFHYQYDPNDYRVVRGAADATSDYLLEAEHLEAVYRGDGSLAAKYFRGTLVDEIINGFEYDALGRGKNLTFHHDHLRSVAALTDHRGRTVKTFQYDPFGSMIGETGPGTVKNRMKYTGREMDEETGLYYYRARYYDPEVGRFLTEDPKGFEAGVNFYAYADNNPVSASDPTGLEADFLDHMLPDEAKGPSLIQRLRQLHYNRNLNNQYVTFLDAQKYWDDNVPAFYHQQGIGNEHNIKFVSPDGHSEAIFRPNGFRITDPVNGPTYNYADPRQDPVGHFFLDMAPYYIWGNTPDDPTIISERFFGGYRGSTDPYYSLSGDLMNPGLDMPWSMDQGFGDYWTYPGELDFDVKLNIYKSSCITW
ncbi:hypothetical protein EPICR_30120 [Candidatus Desulfarcum epimagneticum]|uniref:Uncharacterized protein n=1 Tax=uncultured Desulfobacteraceae bacterium TaxID=218296 RepID=A0A484HHJ3_9BACT|nr:hypothetical protein EPICR_30120 [uncultured Desulfobacteraceae bacterium]